MESLASVSFNSLVEMFLGRPLPQRLTVNIAYSELSSEARAFILRMLVLMKRASFPATDFNTQMINLLFVVNPAMLPSAWGGRIPPLTSRGRHKKLDLYVARQTWHPGNGLPVFVDLGCGFPPVTAADTAKSLPDWLVVGVDRSFASYTVYDAQGSYACFNREGRFLYSQPLKKPLHDDPQPVRERFESLFAALSPHIKALNEHESETIEKDGNRLVFNHVRDFETQNLRFIESDIDSLQLQTARVIRCMNVLLYFEKRVRQKMRQRIEALLVDGGLMISGFNHPLGIYARYAVNKKGKTGMKPCEFAFSMDNLRPLGIGPWVTLQDEDEDAELLADLTGTIRADRRFWPDFNRYVDVLQATYGICRRGSDGFIHFIEEAQTAPPNSIMEKSSAMWNQLEEEGYTDGAVEALVRAGYQAWKNPVGDIAVSPLEGSL